ncbi:hypothetical protein niasHT_004876 [Heterodera trifolii]|uniref:Effector protein n=1 Tax=Heterodera trifolii TaxID=157864 RepID=A0ABD2LS67_9BILA
MACGGLLPLLAAATAPNSELEINDTTQQELDIGDAARFIATFAELSDVFVFASGASLNELEQEKNMPSVSTVTVRNILACSMHKDGLYNTDNSPKFVAIRKFCESSKPISDFERLLQNVDLQRLKGVIYRDMEETKQAQFLALAVVYFLSVLMVSRYRDILEPPLPPPATSSHKTSASSRTGNSPTDEEGSPSMGRNEGQRSKNDATTSSSIGASQMQLIIIKMVVDKIIETTANATGRTAKKQRKKVYKSFQSYRVVYAGGHQQH